MVAESAPPSAFMARALVLAREQLGKVAPNPAVGCVLVRDGVVVGEGATQAGGRPHGEAMALAMAGDLANGATCYVTLEPCAHVSPRGPSCASSLVDAGIAACIIAMIDPDPRTAGRGVSALEAAGISVRIGDGAAEAEAATIGFLTRLRTGRPFVAVDPDPTSYDADFALGFRESFEQALDRMGAEGLTRVRVAPDTPMALALAGRGLVNWTSNS
jgi:diaminohydroxyphosphoribosylaminopyrimidine deaminase/5-amino-6-(5-phosphoribosylamino)uracil reductase